MNKNWLTYSIDQVNYKAGHIQLNAYREDGSIENTYPVTYSKQKEIEETEEVTREEKYIDEEIQQDEDGIDFVAKVVKTREVTETVKTGKMIPNPNYFEPTSLQEIEDWLVDNHWFTK